MRRFEKLAQVGALTGAVVACALPARADSLWDGFRLDLGSRVYAVETVSHEGPATLNPDNGTARLARLSGVALMNVDLKLDWSAVRASFLPRFLANGAWLTIDGASNGSLTGEIYIQEALLSYEHESGFRLRGGRYYYDSGPSVFLAPSNPFTVGSPRLNPKIDPPSREFATASYVGESGWSIGLMANLGPGRDTLFNDPFLRFRRTYAARAELAGGNSTTVIMAALAEDLLGQAGGSFQINLSEAVLAWTDATVSLGHRSFIPARDAMAPSGWNMTERSQDRSLYPVGLIGGSYSLSNGMSISLEYLYNGAGYTSEQAATYYEMLGDLAGISLYPVTDHARRNRARGINTGLAFLRQHYVMTELRQIDVFDALSYSLRGVFGAEDLGGQISALVEYVVSDTVGLFAVGFINVGKRQSEFGRFLSHSTMVGAEIRL